ncbi:hypothetical protein MMC25_003515 [Agyrium rufum]|nr:hypothetical protein [Agyrium rufum]
MAEALALIGLASALVQFVDFGTKVIRHLRQIEDQAADIASWFKSARYRLPLMLDLVRKIMLQMDAGLVSDKSKEAMYPVVHDCISQAQELDRLLDKFSPKSRDSSWIRGKKAIYAVWSESEVERIDAGLKSNFELLMQAGTFQAINQSDGSKNISFAPTFTISPTVQVTMAQQESQPAEHLPWDEPEKQSASTQSVFLVSFPRDANFLGRQDIIDKVTETFEKTRVVALSGLGGIGKSQIAIEYCYIFRDTHPNAHVFWVYGADASHFEQGYQEIARRAKIPGWDDQKTDKLSLVQDWLQDENTSEWLMVVDNADDAAMFYGRRPSDDSRIHDNSHSFARFFPQCSHGRTLVTTRDKRLGEKLSDRKGTILIAPLNEEKSKDLLRSRISEDNWSETVGSELVKFLSYLPLAITQAAAFISENSMTVSEYVEMLMKDEDDMKELLSEHLEDSRRDWNSENSVIRTWKLSFDQISKESPRAAEMLSLLATLGYNGAPRSLLRRNEETETGFRTALGVLQAFSLITVTRSLNAICKMHRLVSISTQRWLEHKETIIYWQSQALNILTTKFPGPGQQHFREFANMVMLMPHTTRILSYQYSSKDDQLLCAKLLISTALFDLSSAHYQQALEKCERSLKIREKLLPSDHFDVLESVQTLGETLLHLGELTGAKTMLERAIEGREKTLGPLSVDTLESLSDLTITLLELNDLESARATGQRALQGREEVLGHEHPDYLVSLNIVSILEQMQGNLTTALDLNERVLRDREKILGAESPDTIMTLNNLARLKLEMGDVEAASRMLDRVLEGEEKSLAGNGYDVQVSLSNKAAVLVAQERFQDAENILRNVRSMREKELGLSHPLTLFSVEAIATVQEHRGNAEAARVLRDEVARIAKDDGWRDEVGALLRAGLLFD